MNKINNAENKLAKFGETSAHNGGGNPELSLKKQESVETRRRVCKKCDNVLPKRRQKFCSDKCRNAFNSHAWRIKKGLIKKPYSGSGGNQSGKDNHMYKNGIRNFSLRAFEYYGKTCNRCESEKNILTHHKDHNRQNNNIENLEVLCKKCHQKHHCTRDQVTGRYIKG
ncbi:HNH endonuclease [Candidatus Peregrinibacteria bacterium]|jgi:hypothetical protein|nr:HNH endonuclease [Candidatus Peregrinibacteria bacterium]